MVFFKLQISSTDVYHQPIRDNAQTVDIVSRAAFPVAFLVFCITYWSCYLSEQWFPIDFYELKGHKTQPNKQKLIFKLRFKYNAIPVSLSYQHVVNTITHIKY